MKITSAHPVLSRAFLLAILFSCLIFQAGLGTAKTPAATAQQPTGEQTSAPQFPFLRLEQHAKPPASCDASIYGAVASRASDGALCLCHQGYDGKPLWEQIGTGRACWPAPK